MRMTDQVQKWTIVAKWSEQSVCGAATIFITTKEGGDIRIWDTEAEAQKVCDRLNENRAPCSHYKVNPVQYSEVIR